MIISIVVEREFTKGPEGSYPDGYRLILETPGGTRWVGPQGCAGQKFDTCMSAGMRHAESICGTLRGQCVASVVLKDRREMETERDKITIRLKEIDEYLSKPEAGV